MRGWMALAGGCCLAGGRCLARRAPDRIPERLRPRLRPIPRRVTYSRIAGHRRHHGGEFRGHGLADDDAAGAARQRHRRRIGARLKAGVNRRAVLGREIGGIENILEPDRQAAQRRCGELRVFRRAARRNEIEHDEGADLLLARGDRLGAQIERPRAGVSSPASMRRARSRAESIRVRFRSGRRCLTATRRSKRERRGRPPSWRRPASR